MNWPCIETAADELRVQRLPSARFDGLYELVNVCRAQLAFRSVVMAIPRSWS